MPKPQNIVFQRRMEPSEGAFSLSIPSTWLIEGGIQRANLMNQVVNAQSIEAKVDFIMKNDSRGTVMMRFCPETKFCDVRYSPAGMMGLFPQGSLYNGMIVHPVLPAAQFLLQIMFPWAHPQASNGQVVDQRPLPDLIEKYRRKLAGNAMPFNFSYDAAAVTYTYMENGQQYRELAMTVIENLGAAAAGMWSNKESCYMRAPANEFDDWAGLFRYMLETLMPNPAWLQREMQNQQFLGQAFRQAQQAEQYRARQTLETQHYLQDVEAQIVEHRRRVNAEIRNDQYLNMTNQEEYRNPYTGDTDLGSNQYRYRWVNNNDQEFYTDDPSQDPNHVDGLSQTEWKQSQVRPRYPDQG